jgi:hypothetical protein
MEYNNLNFIEKSIDIHGDKYNYDLVEYVNSYTKIKIICKEHGEFEQTPRKHLSGQGCRDCGYNKLKSKNFILNASKIHNNEFDYSLVEYVNSHTKVKIICREHGIFEQNPNSHLNGQKCKKCVIENNKLTNEEFIEKSNIVHSNKYDYSLVNYINNIIDVDIICKEHGIFKQRPSNHLTGNGCTKCYIDKFKNNSYIEKCNNKFNNEYDYSLVDYKNNKLPVDIICKKHGIFKQNLKSHLKGSGCPYCSGKKMNTYFFIEKSNIVHNNFYDYSKTEYIKANEPVLIICPIHGEFKQKAYIHSSGSGCMICKSSKGEREIIKLLNNLNVNYIHQKKFKDCKYLSNLIFDFYLPDYDICIEYNGAQHYEPFDYFGGKESFELVVKRDKIKKNFCRKNNINLFTISYKKNIEKEIKKIIEKCHLINIKN